MTRALPTYYRSCLDCPRTIPADSDEMRCPGCKAKRAATAKVTTLEAAFDPARVAESAMGGCYWSTKRELWALTETRQRRSFIEDDIAAASYGPSRGPQPWPARREEVPCPF